MKENTSKILIFLIVLQDLIKVKLNYNDINLLNINYIVSDRKIKIPKKYKSCFDLLYDEDKIFIYKYNK